MVSYAAMAAMALQAVISVLLPIFAYIFFRRRGGLSWKPLVVGILVFIVFSQGLEKLLHLYVLTMNPATAAWLKNGWIYAAYGALAAGVFEEVGRYAGIRLLLRRHRDRQDGLAVGIGHGGIEAVLIGAIGAVQSIVFANMINAGTLDAALGSQLPAETLNQLRSQLTNMAPIMYMMGGVERAAAFFIQVAMSLLVLYGIRVGRIGYLFAAIGLHAAVDFFVALYQVHVLPLWSVEIITAAAGAAAVVFIRYSRKLYNAR